MTKILAVIPARGGSKGLPNKNIKMLLGHPLIAYSIKAAKDSKRINRVIVSTDSEDIANVARQYNAEIPFMRPAELAQDLSTDLEVFIHLLGWLKENENYVPDIVVQLRPTSPVRFAAEIDDCIDKVLNSDAESLRIVTPSPYTPYKMWSVNEETSELKPILFLEDVKEPFNQPRQSLPKVYWQVGTLDVIKTAAIREKKSMSGDKILSHIIPNEMSVDIDNLQDFLEAEEVIAKNNCIKFS